MNGYVIRRWYTAVEEIYTDGGPAVEEPLLKAVAAAIVQNPFAGRYVEDLSPLTAPSAMLGEELGRRAKAGLGGRAVESYGKGGIAGMMGEQEHVVACVTTVFGDAFRDAVGGGKAWISSASKVGVAGESIDIPLAHKDALYIRSHYDAVTLRIPGAPRPDELVIAVAVASRGRVHHRVGGLSKADAKMDGLH